MLTRLAVVALACALAACGAGGEETTYTGGPWGKTFGGLADADLEVMDAVTADLGRFNTGYMTSQRR